MLCPSGTGRFIADSWFSDEPLPRPTRIRRRRDCGESGGVSGKTVDREAVEEYLRAVNLPAAIDGVRQEAARSAGCAGSI